MKNQQPFARVTSAKVPRESIEEKYIRVSELNMSLLSRVSKLKKSILDDQQLRRRAESLVHDNEVIRKRNDELFEFKIRILNMSLLDQIRYIFTGERGMTPPRDYVDVSPSKKTSRIDTLMSVLAVPMVSAAIFSMSTLVVEWHVAAVYGFSVGYVLQAVLVFTWDAIKSIIKGDSRG